MDYVKLIEQCKAELKEAQEANDTEQIDALEKELQRLRYESQKQREYDVELSKKVKPEQVLSDYFLKRSRLRKLSADLLRALSETFLREPVETDEYGSYKPGMFTYKRCVVSVESLEEDGGLWRLHIMGEDPIPDSIVWEARDRFVPDRCTMVRLYDSRSARFHSSEVVLLEFPEQANEG